MPLLFVGTAVPPFSRLAAALAVAGMLVACAHRPESPLAAAPAATLYERLGGAPNVDLFVGRLVDRAAADPSTARSFDGIKLATLKASIAQQICALAGGGCRYEGETMARSHADLKIVASEFDALVAMLRQELDRAGVSDGAKNDLLRLMAPMKRDIVNPPAAALAKAL